VADPDPAGPGGLEAALVAMYYMHLKFEPPRLIMLVLSALPLAILLSLIVVTMEPW
jgi:hypothetical protein